MNPNKMLAQAKANPEKLGLNAYLGTIWELRRKGNTYRQIAEFLKARGVATDHTAVYRLIKTEKPDPGRMGCVLIGDTLYESRKGRPLRPFSAGVLIEIEKRIQILPLEQDEPDAAIWCEAQFELNEVPNDCWIEQLCKCLFIDWNPEMTWRLQDRNGYEYKFEGSLLALVCPIYNLEHAMKDLGTAVKNATDHFREDKSWFTRLEELKLDRNKKIVEGSRIYPGESIEEVIEEALKWNRDKATELAKKFKSIQMP